MIKILVVIFTFFMSANSLQAYPNFIGFGYNSCTTCHYNPYGNGPLSDYGRALSATEIASRIIFSKEKTDEEIGQKSGFLYREPINSWFRPSIDYRGLRLIRGAGKKDPKSEYYNMQADVNATIKIGGSDKYIVSATYGYAPVPESKEDEDIPEYRSREHYVGIRPNSNYGLYVGMMDKVFGIRIPDHIAFSRSVTRLAQNDQTHGVLFHLNYNNFEVGLQPFVGNLGVDKQERQQGVTTMFEYSLSNYSKPGFSVLQSKSDFIKMQNTAVHMKQGLSKGSSVMFEFGQVNKEDLVAKNKNTSTYAFMQNHMLLQRGLYAFVTTEYLRPSQDLDTKVYRIGPGVQYFPVQGIEMRMDIYNSKTYSSNSATGDSWDIAGQIHLWL